MKRPVSIACLAAALAVLGGCQPTPRTRAVTPVVAPAAPPLARAVATPPRCLRAVHRHARGAYSRRGELASGAYAGPGPHPYAPPATSQGYGASSHEDSRRSEWSEHGETFSDEGERAVSLRRWTGLDARGYLTWPGKIETYDDRFDHPDRSRY